MPGELGYGKKRCRFGHPSLRSGTCLGRQNVIQVSTSSKGKQDSRAAIHDDGVYWFIVRGNKQEFGQKNENEWEKNVKRTQTCSSLSSALSYDTSWEPQVLRYYDIRELSQPRIVLPQRRTHNDQGEESKQTDTPDGAGAVSNCGKDLSDTGTLVVGFPAGTPTAVSHLCRSKHPHKSHSAQRGRRFLTFTV